MSRKKGDEPAGSENEPADYDIGYRRPPKASQFKKGQSGNPRGRPRGARNRAGQNHYNRLTESILAMSTRPITVRDGDKLVTISSLDAVMASLLREALKGRGPAMRFVVDLVKTVAAEKREENRKAYEFYTEHKFRAEHEIWRCREQGLPEPDILPHPDHVIINPWTGAVSIVGPISDQEKREYEILRTIKPGLQAFTEKLERRLRRDPDNPKLLADLAQSKSALDNINAELNREMIICP